MGDSTPTHTTPPGTRARALLASSRGALLASLRYALLDPEQAERDATAALELYRQLGDEAGVAESLVSLGYRQVCLGRYRQASALAQQALVAARASRDDGAIGWALWLRATAGEGFDEVRSLAREAIAHFRHSGATRRIYPLLNTAAYAVIEYARYREALPLLDEALSAARAADDGPGIAVIAEMRPSPTSCSRTIRRPRMPFQSNSGSAATCPSTRRWRRRSYAPRR